MTVCSVLICGNDDLQKIEDQLRALTGAMGPLAGNYEALLLGATCIEGDPESASRLRAACRGLRLIDPPPPFTELADLLALGLAVSHGETVLYLETGDKHVCRHIPALLGRLARADFVQGKRRRQGIAKLMNRIGRLPRWLLLGTDVRDSGCRFWAARRESLGEIAWHPELVGYLGSLVAAGGYRVDEIDLPTIGGQTTFRKRPARDLFSAWQERRRLLRLREARLTEPMQATPFSPATPWRVTTQAESSNPSSNLRKSA